MAKKKKTKGKIVAAAWSLFKKQGYEDTTIDEIIDEADVSRGTFYYYFNGKDDLLSSLSIFFDDKYEEVMQQIDSKMNSFDKLILLNGRMNKVIEEELDMELLASLYSAQVTTKGDRHLLDESRIYYRILNQIITEGQKRKEIRQDISFKEITRIYALCERAFVYDWCISKGSYSLTQYSAEYFPIVLGKFKL